MVAVQFLLGQLIAYSDGDWRRVGKDTRAEAACIQQLIGLHRPCALSEQRSCRIGGVDLEARIGQQLRTWGKVLIRDSQPYYKRRGDCFQRRHMWIAL